MSCRIQFEQWVPFPLEQVFLFFSKPSNLPRLMPPSMDTQLLRRSLVPRPGPGPAARPEHEGLAWVGSEIVTSFRLFPLIPWRTQWVAEVVEFEWNHYFADVQKKGPFKSFHHRHEFAAVKRNGVSGTIVRDVIRYELGLGFLGSWAQKAVVKRQLQRTFEFRQAALEKLLAEQPTNKAPVHDSSAAAAQ